MGMEDAVPDVIDSSDTRAPLHKLRAKSMMELNAASEEEQEIMRNVKRVVVCRLRGETDQVNAF
jgi:hypothetical protein